MSEAATQKKSRGAFIAAFSFFYNCARENSIPRITPSAIDSNGKPGIPPPVGSEIGADSSLSYYRHVTEHPPWEETGISLFQRWNLTLEIINIGEKEWVTARAQMTGLRPEGTKYKSIFVEENQTTTISLIFECRSTWMPPTVEYKIWIMEGRDIKDAYGKPILVEFVPTEG